MSAVLPPGLLPPDHDRAHWALGLIWAVRAIAICVVILRLYTRVHIKHTAGWDDVCISIAACLAIFGGVNDNLRAAQGWGRHVEYLSSAQVSFILKWITIGLVTNTISLFFVRLSICVFTLRLLPSTQTWPIRFTLGAATLNLLVTLENCIVFTVRCNPTAAIWDTSIHGKCLSSHQLNAAFDSATAVGVLVDFVVIAVPVFVIRNLQMDRRTKIGVCTIMCLSFLTACLSIGKMVSVINLHDPSYDTVPVTVFSLLEEECGIICASIPAINQLYRHIKEKRRGHYRLYDEHPGYRVAATPNETVNGSGSSTGVDRPDKSAFDIEMDAIKSLERD